MKCITITTRNRDLLANRFSIEPLEVDTFLPLGYVLVTEFGNDETFELITAAQLDELFVIGEDIGNGFKAITRK